MRCTAFPSCSMCNLVPQSGIEPRSPVLGVWHVLHCTTREVPGPDFLEVRAPPNFYMAPEDIKVLNPWLVAGGEMAEGACCQRRWLLWQWEWEKEVAATAAAKSLQSCPTLCDPIDGSPPGSPVPGILQARILEWVAISFCNAGK